MGEDAADEEWVAKFWRAHGLEVEALEDPAQQFLGLPDFRLLRDGETWAYCEVKTLWRHSWTVRILHGDRPAEERREETEKPVGERIAGDLVAAIRQLHAGNPSHNSFNFVVLINRDREASPAVLTKVLAQPIPVSGRSLAARRAARLAQEVRAFRRDVDLCLWAIPGADEKPVIEKCFLFNPVLRSFAEEITGLRGRKLVFLEPAA